MVPHELFDDEQHPVYRRFFRQSGETVRFLTFIIDEAVAVGRPMVSTGPEDGKALRDEAVRTIEDGRADHVARRTFTLAEIKKELGIAPGGPGCTPE